MPRPFVALRMQLPNWPGRVGHRGHSHSRIPGQDGKQNQPGDRPFAQDHHLLYSLAGLESPVCDENHRDCIREKSLYFRIASRDPLRSKYLNLYPAASNFSGSTR